MPLLEIYGTRPLISWTTPFYLFDAPPRLVINGVECQGSWKRDSPFAIEIFPGIRTISAYQPRSGPPSIFRVLARTHRLRVELALDVAGDCSSIAIEFRGGRTDLSPGELIVRQILYDEGPA